MGGVREVHAPDGRVWWVKRAWVPRYLTLRDRLARYFAGRRPRWYEAPLRWFAGGGRRAETSWVPPGDLSHGEAHDAGATGAAGGRGDVVTSDVVTSDVGDAPLEGGDVGDGALEGGDFGPGVVGSGDFGTGVLGAGDFDGADVATVGDVATGAGVVGDAGGGDLDLDLGPGDGDGFVYALVAILAGALALALAWFVLLPLLLVVVDGVVLLVVVLLAGLVRLLFRRPWDVVAAQDRPGGGLLVRRWEVRGFRRAGHVRDDVARALETGTDPELAVTRVLLREPRDDDPPGSARSVRERV